MSRGAVGSFHPFLAALPLVYLFFSRLSHPSCCSTMPPGILRDRAVTIAGELIAGCMCVCVSRDIVRQDRREGHARTTKFGARAEDR